MKDSSKSTKNSSKGDDEARRMKRKSKKRRRDRSLSTSSSDSEDSYTKGKRRRKEAKRKSARCSRSDDGSTLRRKGKKRSRKSEGEYRKKSSKVKQKGRRNARSHKGSSASSSSDYSSDESCSTCRDSYGSDEKSWYKRSKREEIVRKGGSNTGESKKKESGKGSGREVDRHSSGNSSSCSECMAKRAEVTEDVRRLVKKGNGDQETGNEVIVVTQFCEDGVSGKDDECHADHEDGAENATERKYIDENERWEMGAENDILLCASSSIMKLDPERDPQIGNSPLAPNIVHNGRGSQNGSTNSHQYEICSNHCQADGEDDTSLNIGSSDDRDLEAILRQKALENLKRFHDKQQGKAQALVKEHADGGGVTLTTAKTVGEGTGRTSSLKAGTVAEALSDRMLERGRASGIPGVEDRDRIGNNSLSNYSDSSRARSILSSIPISAACNTDKNDNNSKVTEARKAGGGASGNKNSAFEQNRSQKVPHQTTGPNGTPATMLRESETKAAASSVSSVVHDLEANGTDKVPSVASVGSGSAITNFEQTGSKPMTTDASQFEQKTMSVMRGGEMVQVSYKVYIPKKAPALARRQLQR